MTLLKALQVGVILDNLSGYVTHLHDGKPIQLSFKFSADTRFHIASVSRKINEYRDTYEKARVEIIKQHGGPWEKEVVSKDKENAERDIKDLLDKDVEDVGLILPKKEILSDDNPIPPATIESLLDYIK